MRHLLTFIVCCTAASCAEANQHSLIKHSPFMPAKEANGQKGKETEALNKIKVPLHFTLKGVAQLSGTYYFSIFDQETKRSAWLESGENYNGLTVIGLNSQQKQLIIRYNNTERVLALAHADDTAIPVPSSTQSPGTSTEDTLAPIISRRPTAFTASVQHAAKTAQTLSIHDEQLASRSTRAVTPSEATRSESSEEAITTTTTTTTTTAAAAAASKAALTASFNNRFGIDRSRISRAW
jgi:hypothetical protein